MRHTLQYPAMLLMACSADRWSWDSAHACACVVIHVSISVMNCQTLAYEMSSCSS
jgi:hypothetical protein